MILILTNERQRHRSAFALLLAAAVVGSLIMFASTRYSRDDFSSRLRNNGIESENSSSSSSSRRRLSALSPIKLVRVTDFKDPKTITPRSSFDLSSDDTLDLEREKNQLKQGNKSNKDEKQKQQHLSVKKYSLENALQIFEYFDTSAGLIIYEPSEDSFHFVYASNIIWEESRFVRIRVWVTHSLRLLFPERFTPDSPEFVMPIGSWDYPQVKFYKMDCFKNLESKSCVPDDFPPILQFSSVFRLPKIPSTIPMPMPEWNHLGAFHMWLADHELSKLYQEKDMKNENSNGLVFGETLGIGWDDLIPQVVSRTSDRGYLSRMYTTRRPFFEEDIKPKLGGAKSEKDKKKAAIKAIFGMYDELIPRWKAVAWTAEAEMEAEEKGDDALPWCNIKFAMTHFMDTFKESEYYTVLMDHGIPAVAEKMDLAALAKYKYHVDIGGGGGTTWSGTFEKLALPGVLFHHVTPTVDYNHARIKPWVHYIPLDEDLRDLKEKYEWAESHPEEARKISERATAFIKSLGTEEGFDGFYKEFYEEPLRQVVNAYQPLSKDGPSWQEMIKDVISENRKGVHPLRSMIKCGGHGDFTHDCEDLDDEAAKLRDIPVKDQPEKIS